jgi:hypothetical protein
MGCRTIENNNVDLKKVSGYVNTLLNILYLNIFVYLRTLKALVTAFSETVAFFRFM